MEWTPIKRQSTLDGAITAIRGYIIDNQLPVGAALPTEMRLADELGISRNILREALQHYRTLGIIESRPKVGASIARLLPDNPYENYLPFIAAHKSSMLPKLAEARFCLETGAARVMAARATPDDIAEIVRAHQEFAHSDSYESMRKFDIAFHSALLRSTHNALLEGMIPLLVDFFGELRPLREASPTAEETRRICRDHDRILNALRQRDGILLQQELERHIGLYLES